jgi:TrmH family RNA methyltransferase
MTVMHITGRDNALIKKVHKLCESGRARRKNGLFPVMGEPFLLYEALNNGCDVETVICIDEVYPSLYKTSGVPPLLQTVTIPAALMQNVAPLESVPKILFLCRLPVHTLQLESLQTGRHLVLDGIQDPGNIGTLLRTADAFSFTSAILTEGCADPYAPKVTRAASGAHFRMPAYCVQRAGLQALLSQSPLAVWAAERSEAAQPPAVLRDCGILVLGSEVHGVSPELRSVSCGSAAVAIRGDSLNVAVAGGILMYEMVKGV